MAKEYIRGVSNIKIKDCCFSRRTVIAHMGGLTLYDSSYKGLMIVAYDEHVWYGPDAFILIRRSFKTTRRKLSSMQINYLEAVWNRYERVKNGQK